MWGQPVSASVLVGHGEAAEALETLYQAYSLGLKVGLAYIPEDQSPTHHHLILWGQ